MRLFFSLLVTIITWTYIFPTPLIDHIPTKEEEAQLEKKPTYLKESYLTDSTNLWEYGDPNETIEFKFENATLKSVIDYFAEHFNITFLLDDSLTPAPAGSKPVLGNTVSFTTNKPFSKKDAWSIFTSFLDLAGLTIIPGPSPRVLKIAPTDPKSPLSPGKNPLPLYIDTKLEELPNDDTVIRYIVFIKNTSITTIVNVINEVKSAVSPTAIVIPEMRAIILTDKASNLKNMLAIIQELDKPDSAEILKILKLDRIDATRAVNLYKELIKTDEPSLTARLLGQRKKPSTQYFSENVRLTPIPHLNAIVMIGAKDSVQRVYDFIEKTLDRRTDVSYTPIFTYALKYTNAESIAKILNSATQFQRETDAAKYGGVRDGDKYFKPVYIEAEKSGNRLIIYADYDDYAKIHNLIKKIDVEQPQVAIKILILDIDLTENKDIGTQLRNKVPGVNGFLTNNVNFQTSGLVNTSPSSPVIENPNGTGATRLLGDLIQLASLSSAGSTLLTLGADVYGVWGLFSILEQYTKTSVIANPFLVTTNKYPAQLSFGTIRRVVDSVIQNGGGASTDAYKDLAANLTVSVTPQISTDGLITLDVIVNYENFTLPVGSLGGNQNIIAAGNRTRQNVNTSVIMTNNEVLALGGLIQDTVQESVTKVPILGDIPILGNLFKNTTKSASRSSILILIIPEIIPTEVDAVADNMTEDKVLDTKAVFYAEKKERDPVLRWFFKDTVKHGEAVIDEFVSLKDKYIDESEYVRESKPARLKRGRTSSLMHHVKATEDTEPEPIKSKAKSSPERDSRVQIETIESSPNNRRSDDIVLS